MIYVALLRGINVGGNNKVSMAALKICLEELGYESVKTYINSGNVIFKSSEVDPRKLESAIENSLVKTFGHSIKVVVRSLPEIAEMMTKIPKGWHTATDKKCNVIFLRHAIDSPEVVSGLNPKPGIEELIYHKGVLLWAANTSDLTKSSMIKLSMHGIYKEMTIRNLNTTRKIYELMSAAAR
ncbi:MAG: hypothetical protein JWO35_798 [Candidatus Saccharibacteria bacterium]|nr:hypothetical protein [Candidatus Saccharibacteria bacterium]